MTERQRKLLKEFTEELSLEGRSRSSVSKRRNLLKPFFQYLEEEDLAIEQVGVKEAQAYQGYLIERGRQDGGEYAKGSLSNFIKATAGFYRFLKKEGATAGNPFSEIKKIRVDFKLPRHILKESQMSLLLERLSLFEQEGSLRDQIRGYRVHVICELMYSTALRISEVGSLKEEDIDFERGVVEVEEGKGGRKRTVFLNDYAAGVIFLYVSRMRHLVLEENSQQELLFGAGGKRLDTVVNEELKKACSALEFKAITSHGFRHAVGCHLLKAGCDIRYIQQILGHEKIRSTEIYTQVEKEELRQVLDTYHPRKFRSLRDEETHLRQGA